MSRHIRIKRLKYGFYRIYFKRAYIHEIYQEMPQYGYNIEEENPNVLEKKYREDLEDNDEFIRKIKNYKEGYWDALDRIRTRVWMMKHDKEFHKNATERYKTVVVK